MPDRRTKVPAQKKWKTFILFDKKKQEKIIHRNEMSHTLRQLVRENDILGSCEKNIKTSKM